MLELQLITIESNFFIEKLFQTRINYSKLNRPSTRRPFFWSFFMENIFDLDFVMGKSFIAGCDEVGRGPIAGPVVAATSFFEFEDSKILMSALELLRKIGVTDSKKLTAKKRKKILESIGLNEDKLILDRVISIELMDGVSIKVSISELPPKVIDEINILNASLKCMSNSFYSCLNASDKKNGTLLVDGNKVPSDLDDDDIDFIAVVKGDSKSVMIGLASVIAKEYRDNLMEKYAIDYPGYGLERHAGYPTVAHKDAVKNLGVTPIHRKSFKGVREHIL